MSRSHRDIRRYALYGEGNPPIAPEFLHIETISARSSQHEWTIAPHAHPGIFQLLVLQSGTGEMVDDTGRRDLHPCSVVAVPSGAVHAFRFGPGAQGWVLSVADALLHDARLSGFGTMAGLVSPVSGGVMLRQWPEQGRDARRLAWLLEDLAACVTGEGVGTASPSVVAELAMVLTLVGADRAPASAPVGRGRQDALVARFRRLVEIHYREGWTVAEYAAALAATTPTLTRACRAVIGRAPGEVVQDRLLLEAMRLLTYTASSISEIAEGLGFADPAYFARFFKGHTGVTASAFRQQRRWFGPEPVV